MRLKQFLEDEKSGAEEEEQGPGSHGHSELSSASKSCLLPFPGHLAEARGLIKTFCIPQPPQPSLASSLLENQNWVLFYVSSEQRGS